MKRVTWIAVAVACAGLGVGGATALLMRAEEPAQAGPLAVVLAQQPDRLVAVDLDTMRVVRRVELRSLASGMDVDPVAGIVVTAQCGGLADRSDDAAGVWDPRSGGAVRYVKLSRPNPRRVVWCGGRALLDHGWFEGGRLAISTVDARGSAAGPLGCPTGPVSSARRATPSGRSAPIRPREATRQAMRRSGYCSGGSTLRPDSTERRR